MEPLKLFNTRTKAVEQFTPIKPGHVGLYACGPTVYSYAHIGNMRTYIMADTLRRLLEYFGFQVHHVMNITDVGHLTNDADFSDQGEDKLEVGAKREGLTAWEVAQKYTDAFFDHADKLNIKRPHVVCRATDHIEQQIAMISALQSSGHTYGTDDGIYFDTSKFAAYADFAKLDVAGLREGHRIDVKGKRNKTDFALWKFSKAGEKRAMEWPSPFGVGFPGWHIECSAMSMHYLGEQFDIHTGGVDHIPIHHTNEIAQSECATGKSPFVRFWMHGEFLIIDDAPKMSKSLGNILTVDSLMEQGVEPTAYRTLCLQTHYRKQLKFSDQNMLSALKCFARLYETAQEIKESAHDGLPLPELSSKGQKYIATMTQAMANDMNTPQTFANLWTAAHDRDLTPEERLTIINEHDTLLGLGLFEPKKVQDVIPPELNALLEARNDARAKKDWAASDRLRDEILQQGYEILDGKEGSQLKKKISDP
jgi:cysteinyl-tRNA synthetase